MRSTELPTPARLAAFGAALALAFGAAVGAGAVLDPTDSDAETSAAAHDDPSATHGGAPPARDGTSAAHDTSGHGAAADPGDAHRGDASTPGGLATVQDGYALRVDRTTLPVGVRTGLRFAIEGPDGRPVVRGYDVESERELHLVLVRRDGQGFQHLHPRRDARGTWSVPLTLPRAGTYRLLADFTVGGVRRTLGVDLQVPGAFAPVRPAPVTPTATVDGYDVRLRNAAPRAGRPSALAFVVTRGGSPVADLRPYLGAAGHLVALREGDLAYLHVHPEHQSASGTIPFAATFPSAGRYRLFLQFRAGGAVRTAPMTVEVAR